MSAADDEPTINGSDYDSETASLDEEDKKHIEDSIKMHIRSVVELRKQKFDIPETVSILDCPDGSKVYLVGTAHFSEESINDVINIMSHTHPDFVVVELCANRSQVLTMDEEKIKQHVKELSLMNALKSHGVAHGVLQYLLLRLNAYLIKTLGMAPGGEFRAAVQEGVKQPHCHIVLGDRLVGITLRRAFDALGPWTKLKLVLSLMFDFEPITKEQVEEMKKSDFLEKMFLEMAGEHPELIRILVDERDMYLAKSIWSVTGMPHFHQHEHTTKDQPLVAPENDQSADDDVGCKNAAVRFRSPLGDRDPTTENDQTAPATAVSSSLSEPSDKQTSSSQLIPSCCPYWPSPSVLPRVVVAVVGIGHVNGIKKYWSSVEQIDQRALTTLLEPPISWRIFKWSVRAMLLSIFMGLSYGIARGSYRLGSFLWVRLR